MIINKNNNFKSISNDSLPTVINHGKKKVGIILSGMLITLVLFTGCSMKPSQVIKQNDTNAYYYDVIIEPGELSSLNTSISQLRIYETNLTDISELSNYKNLEYVYLMHNNITDISALENAKIKVLNVSNNNIKNINIANFKYLENLYIEGNFNLYTRELLEYCQNNNIDIDITEQDVKNIETIKEMINSLDFDGKTDFQKENMICDFVCNHMKYDFGLYLQILKGTDNIEGYDYSGLEGAAKGKGVCQSYATLFTAMCQLSGINSYTKNGASLGGPHIWSLVEIDGQYILCDPTNVDNNFIFEEYFLSNSTGNDAKVFMTINETTEVVKNQVESSDKSKLPGYSEEKRHKLMTALLKSAILGNVIFIPIALGKKIMKERMENEYKYNKEYNNQPKKR